MSGDLPETIMLTRDQGVRMLALVLALRSEDLAIRGHEEEDVDAAMALLSDVGEECALQLGGQTYHG